MPIWAPVPHRSLLPAHGLRGLPGDRPVRCAGVRDLELVELPDAAQCCGFGGTFAVGNREVSAAMLADKCAAITATDAAYVAATDNSCLWHIGGGLSRQGRVARPIHYAEILAAGED